MEIAVLSNVNNNYRRAGFTFKKGRNELKNVSASQIIMLKNDPNLIVLEAEDLQKNTPAK